MMHRSTRRFLHASLGVSALTAFVAAAHPRIVAWSTTSNHHLIATTRATSCLVMNKPLAANTIAVTADGVPLAAGKYLCDWWGNTAQTTKGGAIGYIRSGVPEQVSAILVQRNFKPPQ